MKLTQDRKPSRARERQKLVCLAVSRPIADCDRAFRKRKPWRVEIGCLTVCARQPQLATPLAYLAWTLACFKTRGRPPERLEKAVTRSSPFWPQGGLRFWPQWWRRTRSLRPSPK